MEAPSRAVMAWLVSRQVHATDCMFCLVDPLSRNGDVTLGTPDRVSFRAVTGPREPVVKMNK